MPAYGFGTDADVQFKVIVSGGGKNRISSGQTHADADYTGEAVIEGLLPGETYSYRIEIGGVEQETGLDQTFRTPSLPGEPGAVHDRIWWLCRLYA